MIDRRQFLGMTAGAGAALALTPEWLRALQPPAAELLQRAIPSTGEMLPIVGLGRGSRPMEGPVLAEVLRTLVEGGGRVLDAVHGGPQGEEDTGRIARELGVQDRIFWSTGVHVDGARVDPAAVRAKIEESFARFGVPVIDLIQFWAFPGSDAATHLAVLQGLKEEGRIRYVGVSDLSPPQQLGPNVPFVPLLHDLMRNEPIDFIGVDYSAGDRRVEENILPLAQERKIGVLAYFPFDRARIFPSAETPLPEWAADFDATTWAQFLLKYVVSHPAVTVARAGTSNPQHMLDNLGGGAGRLPDEATRKRMAEVVDALPRG